MKFTATLFIGLGVFAVIALFTYLAFNVEWVGLIGLGALAISAIYTATVILVDARGETETDEAHHEALPGTPTDEHHGAPHLPPPSLWPFVCSVGAAVVGVGLIYHWSAAVAGGVILLLGAAGWAGVFTTIDEGMELIGESWRQDEYAAAPQGWRVDDLTAFAAMPVKSHPAPRTLPRGTVFAFVVLAFVALMVALLVL